MAFFENDVLVDACRRGRGSALHLMGLVSDGGVHSHIDHLLALIELARREGVEHVHVHAFTDGRDVSPTSGAGFLERVPERGNGVRPLLRDGPGQAVGSHQAGV